MLGGEPISKKSRDSALKKIDGVVDARFGGCHIKCKIREASHPSAEDLVELDKIYDAGCPEDYPLRDVVVAAGNSPWLTQLLSQMNEVNKRCTTELGGKTKKLVNVSMLRCSDREKLWHWPEGNVHHYWMAEPIVVWVTGIELYYIKKNTKERKNRDTKDSGHGHDEDPELHLFVLARGSVKFTCREGFTGYAIIANYEESSELPGLGRPLWINLAIAQNQADKMLLGQRSSAVCRGVAKYQELAEAASRALGEYDSLELRQWAEGGKFGVTNIDLNGDGLRGVRSTRKATSYNIKLPDESTDDWLKGHGGAAQPFYNIVHHLWKHFEFLGNLYEVQLIVSDKDNVVDGQSLHWDAVSDQAIVVFHLNQGLSTFYKKGKPRKILDIAKEATTNVLQEEEEESPEEKDLEEEKAARLLDSAVEIFERKKKEPSDFEVKVAVEFFKQSLATAGLTDDMLGQIQRGNGSWLSEYEYFNNEQKKKHFSDPGAVMEAGDFTILPTMWPHCGPGSCRRRWPPTAGPKRAVLYMRFDIEGRETSKIRNNTDTTWTVKSVADWIQLNRSDEPTPSRKRRWGG